MASINLELQPFAIPTHVTVKMPAGKKQDGPMPLPLIALAELSEETLLALCEEFTNNVFALAGKAV